MQKLLLLLIPLIRMNQIINDYAHLEVLNELTYTKNKRYINKFHSCRFPGGETFLRERALLYLKDDKRYVTYLVKSIHNNDIIAYFTLSAGAIFWEPYGYIKSNPTIEISYYSLNDIYAVDKNGKGIGLGKLSFEDFILPTIQEINKSLGIAFITLFAINTKLNKVRNAYQNMGFIYPGIEVQEYIQYRDVEDCYLMYRRP